MTELALIFGIALVSLAFAGVSVRGLSLDANSVAFRQLASAVQRATGSFHRRTYRVLVPVASGLACAIFGACTFLRQKQSFDVASSMELGGWAAGSFVIGVAASLVSCRASVSIATRSSFRAAAGARTNVDAALRAALRGGAAASLCVCIASTLGLCLLFAGISAIRGAVGADPPNAVAGIPMMICGYGFGASVVAAFAQFGGGVFRAATATKRQGETNSAAETSDVSLTSAGETVGGCGSLSADFFETITAQNIGSMLFASSLFQANSARLGSPLGVLLFPLIVSAFGIVASIFGVLVVRTDGEEPPINALNRGLYVTATLASAGLAGTSIWIFGPYWLMFFLCGLTGVVTSFAFVNVTLYYTESRYRPVQELARASGRGVATSMIRGLSAGLESTALYLLVLCIAVVTSFKLGELSPIERAGPFGVAVMVSGMLSPAAYVLAMGIYSPITTIAGRASRSAHGPADPATETRMSLLVAAARATETTTSGYASGCAAAVGLLLVTALIDLMERSGRLKGNALQSVDVATPWALLGATLALWCASWCMNSVTRSTEELAHSAPRQPQEQEQATMQPSSEDIAIGSSAPADVRVEALASVTMKRAAVAIGVSILAPVGLLALLRANPATVDPRHEAFSFLVFVAAGAFVGVILALALETSGGAWASAAAVLGGGVFGSEHAPVERDGAAPREGRDAALAGDNVGIALRSAVGPSLRALAKLLGTLALVLAPFFL